MSENGRREPRPIDVIGERVALLQDELEALSAQMILLMLSFALLGLAVGWLTWRVRG